MYQCKKEAKTFLHTYFLTLIGVRSLDIFKSESFLVLAFAAPTIIKYDCKESRHYLYSIYPPSPNSFPTRKQFYDVNWSKRGDAD